MANISLKNVTKRYGNAMTAIQNFNLEINDGAFMVLTGPADCGKSTILRMIAGLEDVSEGQICINGKSVGNLAPQERKVAMILEDSTLYPNMTVAENLTYRLRKQRRLDAAQIERRLAETVDTMGISEYMELMPQELTEFEQKRVALARVVMGRPELLLFDDAMSSSESVLKKQLRIELARIHAKLGITVLYATSNEEEVTAFRRPTIVMKDGKLQQVGTPEELYNHPVNLFVAGFFGRPPMNTVEAHLAERNGQCGAVFGSGDAEQFLPIVRTKQLPQDFVLGIRPEHMSDRMEDVGEPYGILHARVQSSEITDRGCFLHLLCGGKEITANVSDECSIRSGDEMDIAVGLNQFYFFDRKSERAI